MSLVDKGASVPRCCDGCKYCSGDFDGYWCDRLHKWLDIPIRSKKDKECPIVEIPTPHGKLVDADALIEDLQGLRVLFPNNGMDYFGGVISVIQNAPSIIEKEE